MLAGTGIRRSRPESFANLMPWRRLIRRMVGCPAHVRLCTGVNTDGVTGRVPRRVRGGRVPGLRLDPDLVLTMGRNRLTV